MRNKFVFWHGDKHQRFIQADTIVFDDHSQAYPKYPKWQFCNIFVISQEKWEGSSCLQINFKLSCNFILPNLVVMASHTQSTENNKFAKSLQYLKNAHLCWLRSVMGIISSICESKTISNDYFYLKNEGRDRGPVIMFSCLIKSLW